MLSWDLLVQKGRKILIGSIRKIMRKKTAVFSLFSTKKGILPLNKFAVCSLQTCEHRISQDPTEHSGAAYFVCLCVNCVFFSLTDNGTYYKSIKASGRSLLPILPKV